MTDAKNDSVSEEGNPLDHIGEIERRLWSVADQLRANSNFASNEYFLPVMGLIFLRHAYSRFLRVEREIVASLPSRGGKTRPLTKEDFSQRGSIYLRREAQFDHLVAIPDGGDRAGAIIAAMESIERDYTTLDGALPKAEYQELGDRDLGQLLRTFNDPALEKASGDVFGRIYEYFLTQFADQKAHDGGEFFTPSSIVQTIVNVIEPDHGKILDPACGSGGMFVQSAHFIERMKANPSERVTFYGMEKNPTTIRLAKMNLAVHGLEGDIRKAITYYDKDAYPVGDFDFVMANPPFNVDEIDAGNVKDDPRLEFGLPGVNKAGKVSNGNYVWLSYFHAYLSETGRAGFVMSSQASSAGGQEAKVREALIRTGDVDAMIAIRGNFFYTRTVPCELWFYDRGKPAHLKNKLLMIDARGIFRKVSRKVYDFTPEQLQNITAIVWLHRGQEARFLGLVETYLETAFTQMGESDFERLETALAATAGRYEDEELKALAKALAGSIKALARAAEEAKRRAWDSAARDNDGLFGASEAFRPVAERAKMLAKEIDYLAKLAARVHEAEFLSLVEEAETNGAADSELKRIARARGEAKRALLTLEEAAHEASEHLKRARYFFAQAEWLQTRFPEAALCDVEGLVKLVDRAELEKNDWSLTPGRYVGVAPEEEDEEFDFEAALRDIHLEIEGLNTEAADLAKTIKKSFEELTI